MRCEEVYGVNLARCELPRPYPFVVAGGIVRNRAWILPRHLEAVSLNMKPMGSVMFYVTGDNKDETELCLVGHETLELSPDGPRTLLNCIAGVPIAYLRHNTGEPSWTRDGKEAPRYKSSHMAAERNLWAKEALERWPQATHLWVVDSDVLPESDVLERLLKLEAPVAAAVVPTANPEVPIHMMGWDGKTGQARRTGEEYRRTKPHVVSLVGGCYLVRKDVFMRGHDYPWREHGQGEDGGFGDHCRFEGFTMVVDPMAHCQHVMKKETEK